MRLKLVYGDEGRDVTELQQALLAAGFSPGDIDGDFGTGTFNAVSAFQQGLLKLGDIAAFVAINELEPHGCVSWRRLSGKKCRLQPGRVSRLAEPQGRVATPLLRRGGP